MSKRAKREAAEFEAIAAEEDKHEPALAVIVDFNGLYEAVGEPEVWQVLGRLKDLLG